MSDNPPGSTPPAAGPPSLRWVEPAPASSSWVSAKNLQESVTKFTASGLFFMIVGSIFLYFAYDTMGRAHAAMSFVFVVVGVAILLYGTGTQGIGEFNTGENAEKVARYKVALAGGAGVLAFCAAGGIIAFAPQMKDAFQIEQKYLRFHIKGKGYQADDIGLYLPDVRINGIPVPAVRRGDHIEVYAPYLLNSPSKKFEIRAKLHLPQKEGGLRERAEQVFNVILKANGQIEDDGANSSYSSDAGYDFPRYTLRQVIELMDAERALVSGIAPQ